MRMIKKIESKSLNLFWFLEFANPMDYIPSKLESIQKIREKQCGKNIKHLGKVGMQIKLLSKASSTKSKSVTNSYIAKKRTSKT